MSEKPKWEYSKGMTTFTVPLFSLLAVGFVIFVCYEMHRLEDLSPVAYLAAPIVGIPVALFGFYMWRAKAKSKTDLEWEQTKRLTQFREKHPEAFVRVSVDAQDTDTTIFSTNTENYEGDG